jgi:hypothetical protein
VTSHHPVSVSRRSMLVHLTHLRAVSAPRSTDFLP